MTKPVLQAAHRIYQQIGTEAFCLGTQLERVQLLALIRDHCELELKLQTNLAAREVRDV